ncbi:tol-pal system protein YbgF [Enterovirga aerilata]|uniref:Cell division coordinator CpoB n=1 Tax=Enterovirga aerilata TaxID=2730920 RepID=A0A849IA86_9HYPH|nr:tol-pal system protein YbgF [Enterovirga sp. DB1703]NNM74298.1 tol-pal system protein YbgF [Enterovirga sp. DB1703]
MARFAALALSAALSTTPLAPAFAQDAAELLVRLNRLEGQVRQMSGQIEQLQFENRQQKEQLRKFQEDVEFRLQERSGGGRSAAPATTQPSSAPQTPASTPRPSRRSDAFDPDAEPGAPGAPRPLGTTAASPPLADPAPGRRRGGEDTAFSEGAPLDLGAAARGPVAGMNPAVAGTNPAASTPRATASLPAGGGEARADYDAAYAYVLQKQWDQAESALRRFLAQHGRDRLAADATYWLGESYLQRSRHRDAAEQFLKVSTEHTRSSKAPDALLKLGISLSALGAKDQACATFAEVERKYPQASASLKQAVDREQKKARCPT